MSRVMCSCPAVSFAMSRSIWSCLAATCSTIRRTRARSPTIVSSCRCRSGGDSLAVDVGRSADSMTGATAGRGSEGAEPASVATSDLRGELSGRKDDGETSELAQPLIVSFAVSSLQTSERTADNYSDNRSAGMVRNNRFATDGLLLRTSSLLTIGAGGRVHRMCIRRNARAVARNFRALQVRRPWIL